MPNTEHRNNVICDLTEAEYQEQMALSDAGATRYPPRIMRCSTIGHWINEAQISRIASDAWLAAKNLEITENTEHIIDEVSLLWSFQRKIEFLDLAGENWIPHIAEESAYWDGTPAQAETLLDNYPELALLMQADVPNPPEPQRTARNLRNLMDEMTQHHHDSADWQDRWQQIRTALDAMAAP